MNKKRCVRTIFLYSMKIKKMNTMRKNIESFQSVCFNVFSWQLFFTYRSKNGKIKAIH